MTELIFGNDHNPLSAMKTKLSVSGYENNIGRIESTAVV